MAATSRSSKQERQDCLSPASTHLVTKIEGACPADVAARLMLAREAVRTETDVALESRQAEQVPPQFLTQTATAMLRVRDKRLGQEAMRLRARWPVRSH